MPEAPRSSRDDPQDPNPMPDTRRSSGSSGATRARARSWTCSTADHECIVRYNGANAGHTVVVGDERYACT